MLLFLSLAVAVIAIRLDVSTDLGVFLPEGKTRFDRLLRHQLNNGASANIILVALSGLPVKELSEQNRKFAEVLRASGKFSSVTNHAGNLGDEALEFLKQNRYLLTHSDLSQKFSVEGFRQSLSERVQGLASALAPLEKQLLRHDPTGEVLGLLGEWQGKISRHKRPNERNGVWFSDDSERSLILVEIDADISEMENQESAVQVIRKAREDFGRPGLEIVLTGPAVFAVESSEDILSDVRILTLTSVSVVVLFLYCVYHSMRMLMLVACSLFMGVIAATAMILLVYGQIHGVTLAFGITLAGVAVDYPIHLMTGMSGRRRSDQEQVHKIWRTLRLGVLSTVMAYAVFLLSGFGGLQQLGLFTIVGLFTTALFSRWVLPHLMSSGREAMPGLKGFHGHLKSVGLAMTRYRITVVLTLAVSVVALLVTDRPVLHLNVDSLSPVSETRRAQGKLLRDDLGFWYGGNLMLMIGEDKEGVLQFSERIQPEIDALVSRGSIEGYDMAAHFLPSTRRQISNLAFLADEDLVRGNLESALLSSPFRTGVFDPFLHEIGRLSRQDLIVPGMLEETAIGKKLEPLLFDLDGESVGVLLLHGVRDRRPLENLADRYENLYHMHLKSASTSLVERSVDRISVAMLGCAIIIYLLLALAFRCPRRPLKVMVPTFAAAVGTACILVFSGNPLSIFHLISLFLVIGLGLDYALFFNRLPQDSAEWDTTFKSLWVCGITTILVFGILMFSSTPPLHAIGMTVALGTSISMIFASMWAATPTRSSRTS